MRSELRNSHGMVAGDNFNCHSRPVNRRMQHSSGTRRPSSPPPPSFGDRLTFAIWLAGKVLGVDNAKQFSLAIDKDAAQLSKWVREDPRPGWTNIKAVADAVGIDPLWLDDPSRDGVKEPPDFAQWWAARVERQKAATKAARRA